MSHFEKAKAALKLSDAADAIAAVLCEAVESQPLHTVDDDVLLQLASDWMDQSFDWYWLYCDEILNLAAVEVRRLQKEVRSKQ